MPEPEDVERQVAQELLRRAGPVRPVDDAAVYATVAAAGPHRWRFRAMFSATRIIGATAIVALAGGSLLTGALLPFRGDDTRSDAQGPELVTEEVAPGVERIVRDDVGHDLDARHPTYRYDMDKVFVTPDGTVWLSSTYHDTDSAANDPEDGPMLWALGQPGLSHLPRMTCHRADSGFGVECNDGVTGRQSFYLLDTLITDVAMAPDGTVWAVGDHAGENGGLYRITPGT
jgi:hypothetical protein